MANQLKERIAMSKGVSMLAALKFVHFLSLWAIGGAGVGGWILQVVHSRGSSRPTAEVLAALKMMGLVALGAVALLWLTGLAMIYGVYGGIPEMSAFYVKLAGASVLLLSSLAINLEGINAARAGRPPRAPLMQALIWTIRGSLTLVLAATALAFS